MINIEYGSVEFGYGTVLDSHTTRASAMKMPFARVVSSSNGRGHINFGSHSAGGREWGVGLIFNGEELRQIWLQCLTVDGVDNAAISLDAEKLRKDFHDEFFSSLFRNNKRISRSVSSLTCEFGWGKMSSVLDIKGIQALLIISYT